MSPRHFEPNADVSKRLLAAAQSDVADVLKRLATSSEGLGEAEAAARLKRFGPNVIQRNGRASLVQEILRNVLNPLNGLLLALAVISWTLSDIRAAIVISAMVVLSVTLAFVQEHRSNQAAAKLQAMVQTHATVRRPGGPPDQDGFVETPMERLVPGDARRTCDCSTQKTCSSTSRSSPANPCPWRKPLERRRTLSTH